jgi:aryl-alcohol dehydrogenase-like predicted oxidoreductase
MSQRPVVPERCLLAPGLEISRMVTGLWQVADQERGGRTLDLEKATDAMAAYAAAGFDSFDMADHYGSAELITGRLLDRARRGAVPTPSGRSPAAFTKWCPEPGPMTREIVRAGIGRSLERMGVDTIDLLQFHWWVYNHPAYLDAMAEMAKLQREGRIHHLGLTNFNTDHLRVLTKNGVRIASNQVCYSLLDRRAGDAMTEFCLAHGVKLLAYGTLRGGFLSERWLGVAEPQLIDDWSKMKYKRFIDAVGGWDALQGVLGAAHQVAQRHGVSIANVATRWVLDQPGVAAVIVGARLGEREHREDNLRTFAFAFDAKDRARLEASLSRTKRIPGDCGDEYRKPPYLTASGDLSHHLSQFPSVYKATPVEGRPGRLRVDSGSVWEPIAGYSRAVRVGERILISGTTATHGSGGVVCPGDAAGQAACAVSEALAQGVCGMALT